MSEPLAEKDAMLALCKATSDPLRADVLRVLSVESFGVLELCRIFDIPQSGMSHHLKVLANAGLVETRREGNSIFYRRALIVPSSPVAQLQTALFETIDTLPVELPVATRRDAIYQERAEQSREFFRRNADRLKENQDLIAEYHHYSGCLQNLLENRSIPEDARVVEVGPGECDLINHLAETFEHVTAIDNSREMLERTRGKVETDNVSFMEGELRDASDHADLVVCNMVLHHMASPAKTFADAFNLLRDGGALLIADLCPHDQDWTREVCGDLWLGFRPESLAMWAENAGFVPGQSAYLGLRNGFQVQVRLFDKPLLAAAA